MSMSRQIAGINSVFSAIENKVVVNCIYIDEKKINKRILELIALAEKKNIAIQRVDKQQLDLMVYQARHQGVVAEVESKQTADLSLADIADQANPVILMLDHIQDPHNLGACLRSAAAAGVDAVVLPKDRATAITPTVSKVASGGAEILPIFYETNLSRTLLKLQQQNLWAVALAGNTERTIYQLDLTGGLVIIMGAEGKGVSHGLLKQADFIGKIPMIGNIESLNVSVATGIALFEVLRQRGFA